MRAQLRDGSVDEQIEAARWLGLRGVTEVEDDLWQVVVDTRDERLRRVARQMQELLHSPGLVRFVEPGDVLEHLESSDAEDQVEALRHVIYHGLAEALPRVLQLLEDPDEHVRMMALWALGAIDPERQQRPRAMALLEDPADAVRRQALLYFRGHVDPDLVGPLVDRIADPSAEVGELAARVVDQGGQREAAVAEILERLSTVDDAPSMVAWMDALAGWRPTNRSVARVSRVQGHAPTGKPDAPSPAERGVLRRLLSHPCDEVVVVAASLLASSEDRGAVRHLKRALENEDAALRLRAVRALGSAGVTLESATVGALLDDPNAEVRRTAFDLVPALDPDEARALLRSTLAVASRTDSELAGDEVLVGRAVQALAEVGESEDARAILDLAERTESDFVKISALIGLGPMERRLGTRESLGWVRRLLEDPEIDDSVISATMFPLRDLGDASFLPLLASRLRPIEGYHPLVDELVQTISMLLGRELHGPTFLETPP